MAKPTLKVTKDLVSNFNDLIKSLKDEQVLVGIPESKSARKQAEENNGVTNAFLLMINEKGSELNHIPDRQPMAKGIRLAKNEIAEQFKKCAQNVLSSGKQAINIYFNRAGFIASSSIKNVITNQIDIEPPSKATMIARKYLGIKSEKALIVTGEMRNAITHVVRSK